MSASIGSIILIILLIITFFNIYATATKKKRDANTKIQYDALFTPIDDAIRKDGKSWNDARVKRIVTEDGQGIVAVLDDERRRGMIAWNGGTFPFSFDDYVSSELKDEGSGLTLTVTTKDDALDLVIGAAGSKKRGFTAKMIRDMGRLMKEFLDSIQEKEA